MVSPSLDHLPFMWSGADVSVTIEQQIPLSVSAVIGAPRRSRTSIGYVPRLAALVGRRLQAATAFLMLQERQRTQALLSEQVAFARDVVAAANARYSAGTAPQSDVLRAEVEVARLRRWPAPW